MVRKEVEKQASLREEHAESDAPDGIDPGELFEGLEATSIDD
jgi:hypothetical protein